MSTPVRPRRSLRGKVLTGGALGLLALGIWIGSMFPGFGLGRGSGVGEVEPAASRDPQAELDPSDAPIAVQLAPATVAASAAPADAQPPSDTVVVMIYGDGFRLPNRPIADVRSLPQPASTQFVDASLDDVVATALRVPGNESAIKVQVVRHRTATVGALQRLRKALQDAGLRNEQMHQVVGFVD